MRRFRKVRHVPLPLLAVIMVAILFAELARCEREGAKETAAEVEKSVPRRAALTFDDGPNACYTPEVLEILKKMKFRQRFSAGAVSCRKRRNRPPDACGRPSDRKSYVSSCSAYESIRRGSEGGGRENKQCNLRDHEGYPIYIKSAVREWREG